MPPSSAPFPLLYAQWFDDLTIASATLLARCVLPVGGAFRDYTPLFPAAFLIAEIYAYGA